MKATIKHCLWTADKEPCKWSTKCNVKHTHKPADFCQFCGRPVKIRGAK